MTDQLDIFAAISEACTVPTEAPARRTNAEIRAARQERLDARAAKLHAEAESRLATARTMGDAIPFGQPMMPGHYSYKSDRRYRERMRANYSKGFEALNEAQRLEERGVSSAISSDAADAVALLVAKLERAEAKHATMVAANKIIRGWKTRPGGSGPSNGALCAELGALGLSAETVRELLAPRFAYHGQGFPKYALDNSRGRMKQIKDRIEALARAEVRQAEPPAEPEGQRWFEDAESNRVCFEFDGKPCAEVREVLKRNGFRWAPSAGRWQRQATGNGVHAARRVASELERLEGSP